MKKIINNKLFLIIITTIITSSISIYASFQFLSKDIGFEPKDKSWKVNNVEDALNSLKDMKKISII